MGFMNQRNQLSTGRTSASPRLFIALAAVSLLGLQNASAAPELSGEYYIINTYGGFGHAHYGGYLSWDGDGDKASATVELQDPMKWLIEPISSEQEIYTIKSAYGGPGYSYYGYYLSWDGRGTFAEATVEKGDRVEWQLRPANGGGYEIVNTYGGAGHPLYHFLLSWNLGDRSYPRATVEGDDPVIWNIVRDNPGIPPASLSTGTALGRPLKFAFDFTHADADNATTKDQVEFRVFSNDTVVQTSTWEHGTGKGKDIFRDDDAELTLDATKPISKIQLKTAGSDALYIDHASFRRVCHAIWEPVGKVLHPGREECNSEEVEFDTDGEGGWCISLDPQDKFEAPHETCRPCLAFHADGNVTTCSG